MAGHSKWAKVKHFKGAIDAKRGKIFSKLSKEISIAAKIGGADPAMNPRLRMVLLKCRAANMPNDNIERAIKKGIGGGETASFADLTYEIYAPHGVSLLVEVDPHNHKAPRLRNSQHRYQKRRHHGHRRLGHSPFPSSGSDYYPARSRRRRSVDGTGPRCRCRGLQSGPRRIII